MHAELYMLDDRLENLIHFRALIMLNSSEFESSNGQISNSYGAASRQHSSHKRELKKRCIIRVSYDTKAVVTFRLRN